MSKKVQRVHCIQLWSECVRLRDKWCIITGEPQGEAHHLVPRSDGCWEIQFDTDYGVYLCAYCHKEAEYAAHVDEAAFNDKVIGFITDEARRQKILKTLSRATPVSSTSPPYDEIAARLVLERNDRREQYEMDYDCCPREIWK